MGETDTLKDRIARRDFTVGVVGLGYVGLPLVMRFGEAGFPVLGFDTDPMKVEALGKGQSYIQTVPADSVGALTRAGRLRATTEAERLDEPDAIIVCVPTPLTPHREPDLQYVERTAEAIARRLRRGQLVSLESTTYPGTTEEVLLPRLSASGLTVGRDFFLAFSPEREDPGNRQHTLSRIPKVIGGVTPACRELAVALYATAVDKVIPVSTTRVAEATKILENVYRAVNIALVNELKMAFAHMGVDVWEVIEAARTKPFGFQAFYPGPGLGGHCIPIDPFYLTWKAREYGIATRFIELAGEINNAMPAYVVSKVTEALNGHQKPVRGSRILILGVAYKKDIDDPRESPAFEIIDLLEKQGARIDYSDPFFARMPPMRRYSHQLESVTLTPDSLRPYDAVVLVTDHTGLPYELIHAHARLIVDTRNAFKQRGLTGEHVIPA